MQPIEKIMSGGQTGSDRAGLDWAIAQGVGAAMAATVLQWLRAHGIRVLNIAGPRESKQAGIYLETREILDSIQKFHTETQNRR